MLQEALVDADLSPISVADSLKRCELVACLSCLSNTGRTLLPITAFLSYSDHIPSCGGNLSQLAVASCQNWGLQSQTMPLNVCIIAFPFLNLCLLYNITLPAWGAHSACGWASKVSIWYSLDPISFVLLGFPPDFQSFCLPLKQQHCSGWDTAEWFLSLCSWHWGICWPRSNGSCRALALSRHRPLWAVAGDPRTCHVWMGSSSGFNFSPIQ